MKNKLFIVLVIIAGLILALIWHFSGPPPAHMVDYRSAEAQTAISNLQIQIAKNRTDAIARMPVLKSGFVPTAMPGGGYVEPPPETNEPPPPLVIDPKYANSTNWPDDPRPEAKTFHQFAKVANLFNFEPNVTYDKDEDFPHFTKAVGTATHEAQMDTRNNRIFSLYSYRDRSASMQDYPGVTDEWKYGTGKWDERQMIEETFRILRGLGYAETLAAISRGQRQFIPQPWRVTTSDGELQIIYPFAKVILYDEAGNRRVIAEYRMGSSGSVGLVDWSSLY